MATSTLQEILAEAFAALVMPYNVGAHDSSEFNYASGKLDRLTYARIVGVERSDWEVDCLLTLLVSWWAEARLVWPEFSGYGVYQLLEWLITWHWDGMDDIDPAKAAAARKNDLESLSTTHSIIYGEKGLDAETEIAREAELMGVSPEEFKKRVMQKQWPEKPDPPNLPGGPAANKQPKAVKAQGSGADTSRTLAIDYDNTYTADPVLWQTIITDAIARGHQVVCVSARRATAANRRELETALPAGVRVLLSGGSPKAEFAKANGVTVDIWIDDKPEAIHQPT